MNTATKAGNKDQKNRSSKQKQTAQSDDCSDLNDQLDQQWLDDFIEEIDDEELIEEDDVVQEPQETKSVAKDSIDSVKSAKPLKQNKNAVNMPNGRHGRSGKSPKNKPGKKRRLPSSNGKIQSQPDVKPFVCEICGKGFNQRYGVDRHISIAHKHEKPFKCNVCSKSFTQNENLQGHMLIHSGEKPHNCPICDKAFRIKGMLASHIRTHTGEKPFKCPLCVKSFAERSTLRTHVITHTGEKPFVCGVCDWAFSQQCNLKRHLKIHLKRGTLKCGKCSERFHCIEIFGKHMDEAHIKNEKLKQREVKIHLTRVDGVNKGIGFNAVVSLSSDDEPTRFDLEDQNSSMQDIDTLVEVDQGMGDVESNQENKFSTQSVENQHQCYTCNKTFVDSKQLARHNRMHKTANLDRILSKIKAKSNASKKHNLRRSTMSASRSRPVTDKNVLKTNRDIHPNERKSIEQSKSSRRQLKIKSTIQVDQKPKVDTLNVSKAVSKRRNERNYGQVQTKHAQLRTHTKKKRMAKKTKSIPIPYLKAVDLSIVKTENKYACPICSKSYTVKDSLVEHIRSHTGEKPFACKICCKAFSRKGILISHMRTHTGEKPFKCTLCDRAFKERTSLRLHTATHSGLRPFVCGCCGMAFTQSSNLKRHLRLMHGGQVMQAPEVVFKTEAEPAPPVENDFKTDAETAPPVENDFKTDAEPAPPVENDFKIDAELVNESDDEYGYQCRVCLKTFKSRGQERLHMQTHTGAELCRDIDSGNNTDKEREQKKDKSIVKKQGKPKIIKKEPGVKKQSTHKLKKGVKNLGQVNVKSKTDLKLYNCVICEKPFKRKDHLILHLRTHTGEKPYKCSMCSRAFSDPANLKSHMRTHTGEKPYKCTICEKSFGQSSTLGVHLKTHS